MNLLTIAIGLLPCAYAFYVLTLRLQRKDEKFKKLGPMKRKFGDKAGSIIHYVGYFLIPLIIGIVIIVSGIAGLDIVEVLFSRLYQTNRICNSTYAVPLRFTQITQWRTMNTIPM